MTTGKRSTPHPMAGSQLGGGFLPGAGEGKGSGRRPLEDASLGLYKPREHSLVTVSTALCPRGQPLRARPTALAAGGHRNCEFTATAPSPPPGHARSRPAQEAQGDAGLGHQGPRCRAAGRRRLHSPPSTHSESDGGQCGRRRRCACAEGWHRDAGACKPGWGHGDGHCPLITPGYPRPPRDSLCQARWSLSTLAGVRGKC